MPKLGERLQIWFLTATNDPAVCRDYVKSWGAVLIRRAATNAEFTVTIGYHLYRY